MKTETFHNTTDLPLRELSGAQDRAMKQEKEVIRILESSPGPVTAWEVLKRGSFKDYQITSVRRAISNLHRRGVVSKGSRSVPGPYGVRCHVWSLS